MVDTQVILPIEGMDCADCTRHIKSALERIPEVRQVRVLLAGERAIIDLHRSVAPAILVSAIERAGYSVPAAAGAVVAERNRPSMLWQFFAIIGLILFIVVIGEWLGLLGKISQQIPGGVYFALILAGGYPVFRNVLRSLARGQIISHTLMTVGVLAAAAVGEWASAVVIVLFMRIGDWVERRTTDGARRAVAALAESTPDFASVESEGVEVSLPVEQIRSGDIVICRPGEMVAADGEVVEGMASLDNRSISGESTPDDILPGSTVYAGSVVLSGGFRLRAERTGRDTALARIIRLVEEAEADKGRVQRLADRFSAYYLPVVLVIALLTFILRRDVIAAVSVLVVVCSCSIALATPVAMLASIGSAGKLGILIKGGRIVEILPRVTTILIDKTGTLTLGELAVTDVIALDQHSKREILEIAAAVEQFSEHPVGRAIRDQARQQGFSLPMISDFQALPGLGVQANVLSQRVRVGNQRWISSAGRPESAKLVQEGKTVVHIERDGQLVGFIGLRDQLRTEVPLAIQALRKLGRFRLEVLTGDHAAASQPLAEELGVAFRSNLLPEDKIAVVRELQSQGEVVAMIGDGINDAPALAQADVGIAMGAIGSDLAIQTADIVLLHERWGSIPLIFTLSTRTMGVVRTNLMFTAFYNLIGLGLAFMGVLPPALAAAAQSLPDVGIMLNSSRLLRLKP